MATVELDIPAHVAGPSACGSPAAGSVGTHTQWLLRSEGDEKSYFPLKVTCRFISIKQ